jgi:hypothetical protein
MHAAVVLQRLDDDQVVGTKELAVLLNTTEGQIYKLSSSAPDRLPPRLAVFGRKLAWHLGTCRAWLREQAKITVPVAPAIDTPVKRMGRPRSA